MATDEELRLMEVASRWPTYVVLLSYLLMAKKTMSNQWPSACIVDNLDEMGRPGGSSVAEKNF